MFHSLQPFRSRHITRPRVRRMFVLLFLGTALLISIIGALVMIQAESSAHSPGWNRLTAQVSAKTLLMAMGQDIPYLDEKMDNNGHGMVSRLVFELVTSLNPRDPRTFIGHELPMFSLFDANIIVAGPGVDYTSIPIESPPPPEIERAIIQGASEIDKEKVSTEKVVGDEKVFIYHTHYWESYLPEVNQSNPSQAVSLNRKKNINQVGSHMAKTFRKLGIGAVASVTQPKTNSRYAYQTSRHKVKTAMKKNDSFAYLIDLHRDSRPRGKTTLKQDGKTYARLAFVVGKASDNYEQNLRLAKKLHTKLNQIYPGLSTAVIEKPKTRGINGEYNQSLSPNSLLVEVGGVGNTFKEAYRSVDILAKVLEEDILDAKPVAGKQK